MNAAASDKDVFLQPGEMHFGGADTKIRTLVGSCVAITLWHPARRIGGMSHCLLPGTGKNVSEQELDGRYVDQALSWLLHETVRNGTHPRDYQFKLFGGGDMFTTAGRASEAGIGRKNAVKALGILSGLGLAVQTQDLGGTVSRLLIFDVSNGDVWVRYGQSMHPCGETAETAT